MNGWGRYIDDLAAASAALLNEGRSGPQALVLPETAVVARDVVLTELRQLVLQRRRVRLRSRLGGGRTGQVFGHIDLR